MDGPGVGDMWMSEHAKRQIKREGSEQAIFFAKLSPFANKSFGKESSKITIGKFKTNQNPR